MAADQLQQPNPPRVAEPPLGKSGDAEGSNGNVQGRRRSLIFAAIVGSLVLIGAIAFWLYSGTYESTDDAQMHGHLKGITSRIDGEVKKVYAEENQSVPAGQLDRKSVG